MGHNEVIGVCRTGLDAEGLGRDHWNEMLAYHRKPITHWHPLLEVRMWVLPLHSVILLMGKDVDAASALSYCCYLNIFYLLTFI